VSGEAVKLYLSSFRIGNHPEKLAAMGAGSRKALVIQNALDFSLEVQRRKAGLSRELEDLSQLGYDAEQLDLRHYFGSSSDLKTKLAGTGLLWVTGGNAFVLRRAMALSGLDQILTDPITPPNFVYGGYSAGVCVVTPTLRGIHLVDDPTIVPEGYPKEILWDGLSLVPYCIAPHYQSDHPDSPFIDQTVAYFIQHNMPYKVLRDGEVIMTAA
jgi:dipeptidase E